MYNTGNIVPSSALEDMADNAQTFDALVTKTEGTTTDRNGITRRVFQQILIDMGFQPLSGSFQTGATVTARNQTLYDEVSNVFYAWGGVIPVGGYIVPTGSTPSTAGGIGVGAWVDRTDVTLRSELTENGLSVSDISTLNGPTGSGNIGFSQTQSYANDSVGKKLQTVVCVDDFNDYYLVSSDWAPAFTAAFAHLNLIGNGGVASITNGKRYQIESDLHVPPFCRIKGNGFVAASQTNLTNLLGTIPGLVVNTSASIKLYGSASLHDIAVIRKGLVGFENNTTAFSGTAIYTAQGYDDQTIKEVVVLGFNRGIDIKSSQRVTVKDIKLDCLNGIRISNSRDVSRISNVHCWPYITVGGTGDDILYRDGVGIEASGGASLGVDSVDWLAITDCFTFGYRIGLYLQNCMLPTVTNFAADSYTGFSADIRSGMSGIMIGDYVTEPTLISPKLTGLQQNGVLIAMHLGNTSEVCISNGVFDELVTGIHINSGFVSAVGNRYSNLSYAYSVDGSTQRLKARSEHYDATVTTPCYLTSDTHFVYIDESCTHESDFGSSFFAGPGKSISFISVESEVASNYNLQNFSNYQELYTTTEKTITSINDKGQCGRSVVLRNAGSANIVLSGSGFVGTKIIAPNSTASITRVNYAQWIIN